MFLKPSCRSLQVPVLCRVSSPVIPPPPASELSIQAYAWGSFCTAVTRPAEGGLLTEMGQWNLQGVQR